MTIAIAIAIFFLLVWIGPAIRDICILPLWEVLRASGYTKDGLRRERLWHFWMRKSVMALVLAVMAGGMCAIPTALVLLFVLDQLGPFEWEVYLLRALLAAFSLGFFAWMISAPPHRPAD